MRTTLDIPDDLFRQAKVKAANEGLSLKLVVSQALRRGLEAPGAPTTEPWKQLRGSILECSVAAEESGREPGDGLPPSHDPIWRTVKKGKKK
jgi:hypothetical protein